jgi:CMP/dCMP kinase
VNPEPPLIVAIDGPAGVGKSTAARGLAERLGVPYLNTGVMYRTLAWKALAEGVAITDQAAIEALAASAPLGLAPPCAEDRAVVRVLLDGEELGDRLKGPEVSAATSKIAAYPAVRQHLVALQQQGARRFGGVLEGRDIGTCVLPEAPFKFYLDADPEVRFRRRHAELARAGKAVALEAVRAEMTERDERDAGRADSPLQQAADAIFIDTSERGPEEVVEAMLAVIRGS